MTIDQQHLGVLYQKLGLGIDATLIDRRATVLTSLAGQIDKNGVLSLAAVVYGIDIPTADADWFLSGFRKDEPGFAPDGVGPEVELLAAACLHHEVAHTEDNYDYVSWLCLVLESANFGGLRPSKGDINLTAFAREHLRNIQTSHEVLENAKCNKKIDITLSYKPAEDAGANNQWSAGYIAVKDTINKTLVYTEGGLKLQTFQLNNVIRHIRLLEEQMQTQWWAIAGWSENLNAPYAEQRLEEAIVRSAADLAKITKHSAAGPVAAPALFQMVLVQGRKPAELKKIGLKSVVLATPREWRKTWLDLNTTDPYARLTPLVLAIQLATESNDEPDWEAQFARKVVIDLEVEMTPVQIATQLFREILVHKGRN